MKITGFNSENYTEPKFLPAELKTLFYSMKAGRLIKKVICMDGTSAKDNPNQDFIFENFQALQYHVSYSPTGNLDEAHVDKYATRVDGTQSMQKYFYMRWVRSFELCDYIELEDGKNIPIDNNFAL